MKIYLGADHRGYNLKEKVKEYLAKENYSFTDLGAYTFDKEDDYPLIAQKVGFSVASEDNSRGILLCGSGVGIDSVVNKIDGIRASLGKEKAQVIAGRRDDNMNVLVIAADFTTIPELHNLVEAFLKTKYEANERRDRRLEQIKELEENN